MFEQIFEEYRKAVDSSLKMQQEMYRQWMNGWPVNPSEVTADDDGRSTSTLCDPRREDVPRMQRGGIGRRCFRESHCECGPKTMISPPATLNAKNTMKIHTPNRIQKLRRAR